MKKTNVLRIFAQSLKSDPKFKSGFNLDSGFNFITKATENGSFPQHRLFDVYKQEIVGNPNDFILSTLDNSNPTSQKQGVEVDSPELGSVITFPPTVHGTTLDDHYLSQYVRAGYPIYEQKLVLRGGKVSKVLLPQSPIIKPGSASAIPDAIRFIASGTEHMLSLKLPSQSKIVVLDIDCPKWHGGKSRGYEIIRQLFHYHNWGGATKVGPLVVETPRGFHLTFKAPLNFTLPSKRDVFLGIGLDVEIITSGFVAIASPLSQLLYDVSLEDLPVLPNTLCPAGVRRDNAPYVRTDKLIPNGSRFNTLYDMVSSNQITNEESLLFVYKYLCEGTIEEQELNYIKGFLDTKHTKNEIDSEETPFHSQLCSDEEYIKDLERLKNYYAQNKQQNKSKLSNLRFFLEIYHYAKGNGYVAIGKFFVARYGKELGLAKHIAFYMHGINHTLLFCQERKEFFMYDEDKGIWEVKTELIIDGYVLELISMLGVSAYNTIQLASKVSTHLKYLTSVDDFTPRRGFATPQGFVSYLTGKLEPHSPFNYCTRYIPYEVSVSQELTPFIKEWLQNLTDNNPQKLLHLRLMLYINLLGITNSQVALWLYGPPSSGKSTFLNLLSNILGEEQIYTLSGSLLKSDFFLQQLGTKSHIFLPDYKQPEIPTTLTELIRAGVGGDDLSYSIKHSPDVGKKRGGICLIVTSNEPPNLKGDSLQAQRRILWVETGKFNRKFAARGLEGELIRNLPGVVNWILKTPLEYLFLTSYISSVSMITNETPSWCSLTDFINTNKDKFVVHPRLSAPVGIQGGDPGSSLYYGYQAHCNARGLIQAEQIRVNSISEVLVEVLARTFSCSVKVKNTRTGTQIQGIKYHASEPLTNLPEGTSPLDVLIPLHVCVVHMLDPIEDHLIPLYKMPKQFYKYLYLLKKAVCPMQYSQYITVREGFMSGNLNEVDTSKPIKQIEAESFEQFLENCPKLIEITPEKGDNVFKMLKTKRSAVITMKEEVSYNATPERHEAIAEMLDEKELPLVPLSVFRTICENRLSLETKEKFKSIYNQSFEQWESFWEDEDIQGIKLKPVPYFSGSSVRDKLVIDTSFSLGEEDDVSITTSLREEKDLPKITSFKEGKMKNKKIQKDNIIDTQKNNKYDILNDVEI